MTTINSKLNDKNSRLLVWKILFVGMILCFLIYESSFFFAKPTIETVTTPAPKVDANTPPQNNRQQHTSKNRQ